MKGLLFNAEFQWESRVLISFNMTLTFFLFVCVFVGVGVITLMKGHYSNLAEYSSGNCRRGVILSSLLKDLVDTLTQNVTQQTEHSCI